MFLSIVLFVAVACARAAPSAGIGAIAALDGSTFRRDYVFNKDVNGWLKLHRVPANWFQARHNCHLEGAVLASPVNQPLSEALISFLHQIRVGSIYTGVHSVSGEHYYSVEGVYLTEMSLEWAEGEPDNSGGEERCLAMHQAGLVADVSCADRRPYVCYREKVGTMAMNECGNYDKAYVKNTITGSCYKHHAAPATWAQANGICSAEGGHLAIINSKEEAQVLKELTKNKQKSGFIFLGFFSWYKDDKQDRSLWTTLNGQSLEEAGFAGWRSGEPNNAGDEYCGSLVVALDQDPLLNDLPCDWRVPYICEIEAPRVKPSQKTVALFSNIV